MDMIFRKSQILFCLSTNARDATRMHMEKNATQQRFYHFPIKNYEKQRWRVDANNSRNANFDNFVNADKKCSLKYIKQAMCSQIYSGSNPFPCPNVSTSANWLDEISSETSSLHLSFPDALSTCLLVFDGHCSNTFLGMPYASTQVWVKIGSCKK